VSIDDKAEPLDQSENHAKADAATAKVVEEPVGAGLWDEKADDQGELVKVPASSGEAAESDQSDRPEDPEERWWPADNTLRHHTAVRAVSQHLEAQFAGDGGEVGQTRLVPGGSKNGTGGVGKIDLFYKKDGTVDVYEVKGSIHDGQAIDEQGRKASQEAKDYVKALNEAFPDENSRTGTPLRLESPLEVPYTTQAEIFAAAAENRDPIADETLIIDNSPHGAGSIVYATRPYSDDSKRQIA
jgi:hypothetical protein